MSVLSPSRSTAIHRDSFAVMGTVASVTVRSDSDVFADAAHSVRGTLAAADRRFSPFRADSELQRLRRGEVSADTCSSEMRDVLDCCALMTAVTDGAFRALTPGGAVDTTGYVKGWAIQRAGECLLARGFTDWLINVGGDVLAHGMAADDRPWRVAVQHPSQPMRVSAVVPLTDGGAVATSGNAARGAHVWRADGRSVVRGGSCTVIGPRIDVADGLATARWALGRSHDGLAARFPGYRTLILDEHGGLLS